MKQDRITELEQELKRVQRRLDRERRTREEAERLAERGMLDLYQKQHDLTLLQAIALAATSDVRAALQAALDHICVHTGWPVGHVYLVTDSRAKPLVPSALWHLDDPERFKSFREVTDQKVFSWGEGLPGRVLESRRPAWVEDVTKDDNFTRADLVQDLGVRGGLAVPVMANGEVAAVLEFYSIQAEPPNDTLLELLGSVGVYVGRAIEREQAEEALRTSERQFRTLYENSPIGIYRTAPDGSVLMANPALVEMLGYDSLDELRRRNLDREGFSDGDSRARFVTRMSEEGKVVGYEAKWTRKDGSTLTVRENALMVRDAQGRFQYYEGTVEDVSERHEAEQALRESEHRFRSVVESASEAIVLVDASGTIVAWNNGAKRMFGFEEEEAIGSPIETIIPDHFQDWRATGLVDLKREGDRTLRQTVEVEGKRKTGDIFPMELSLTTWRSGGERYVAGIIRDVSERKETELLRLERDAAEAASRAKSTFLATMSHELRTPLNSVIAMSDILTEQFFGDLNEKQAEYVKDIRESGEHLLNLINDILDLTKVETGYSPLEPTVFDLRQLLDGSLKIVRERAQAHRITLAIEAEDLPEIEADERKIRQVVYNLLSNAVKFTPDGGSVTVRASCVEDAVTVSVIDTGIGISRKDQDRIFEEFVQADSGVARGHEGTGLGLALVKQFVEQHGGTVWVESSLGSGCRFTFTLPTVCQAHTAAQEAGA